MRLLLVFEPNPTLQVVAPIFLACWTIAEIAVHIGHACRPPYKIPSNGWCGLSNGCRLGLCLVTGGLLLASGDPYMSLAYMFGALAVVGMVWLCMHPVLTGQR